MKDRLEELRQRTKEAEAQARAGQGEDPLSEDVGGGAGLFSPQAVMFEAVPVLENFLSDAQRVRDDIGDLAEEVKLFSQQQKNLVATMRRFSVMKKESSITRDIKLQAESIHRRLDALAKQVKSAEAEHGVNAAVARIQGAQHAALFRQFQRVIRQYNDTLLTKQDKCKQFIVRQLEVAGKDVSEEDVEDMMAQGKWEVFNENVLHDVKVTRTQLSEIEQRHKELMSLESNMKDLRDLFLEIYMVAEEQGQAIENIECNLQKTQDFVQVSNEKFKMAARYQKKHPLRQICCCCCPCCN
ncbi:syntaxin-19 [Amia ocellicauda]|uniref:syntaxin-19 n=1 Tax=Amia ocellicauda TaxID=2972642 RepID=UPI003464BCB1